MNNSFSQGTGGAFITPSARPSIHNHWGCLFAEGESMVRYGISKNCREPNTSDDDQGTDEVDNIMSKPAHPIRSPSQQKSRQRRSSLDTVSNGIHYIPEYEDDVLSKSVPATLPSRLYCSNYSEDEQDITNENHISDISNYSIGTPNRSNTSRTASKTSTPKIEQRILEREANKSSYSKATISLISLVVVLCGVVCSGGINITQNTNTKTYDKSSFYTDVSSLGEKYNIDGDSILQVQTGISTIFEKQDAGSFIFVYNSKVANFEPREFNQFVSDISYAASKYLRNDSFPIHYTIVDGSRLDMEEHSELICRYREQLSSTGVMLVRNLEAVPSNLAMAFHYYCDEYNPLVKKSAIFFTLNLGLCPQQSDNKSLYTVIEKCLSEKWKGIPPDSIGPLLTRVATAKSPYNMVGTNALATTGHKSKRYLFHKLLSDETVVALNKFIIETFGD